MSRPVLVRGLVLIRSLLSVLLVAAATGCNVGFSQGPDRPEDPNVLGPPPPAAFHCDEGTQRRVEGRDGGGRRLVYLLGNGEVLCRSEDKNGDGKIDNWVRIEQGHVVMTATDTDFDGTLDRIDAPPRADAGPRHD